MYAKRALPRAKLQNLRVTAAAAAHKKKMNERPLSLVSARPKQGSPGFFA